MPTLLGRAAGIVAAIAGEKQPPKQGAVAAAAAAMDDEASMVEEFQHSSASSAHDSGSEARFPSADESIESKYSELSVDSFPRDDEIALVPVHPMIDNGLYEKIWFCQPTNMTDDERHFTNDQILLMGVSEIRLLCKKC
jgi:hypothetical protein